MTIAACYLLPEGLVFGCDSTWTIPVKGFEQTDDHYFDHGQKLFEIGENSTLGILVWGLNSFREVSFRTLVATLADQLKEKHAANVAEVANRWAKLFWKEYRAAYTEEMTCLQELAAKLRTAEELEESGQKQKGEKAEKRGAVLGSDASPEEESSDQDRLDFLMEEYKGGFCVGGYCLPDRAPFAYEIRYDLSMPHPELRPLEYGVPRFWGWGNLIQRLLFGMDERLMNAIADSPHWSGKIEDLTQLISEECLVQPTIVPIREAVDWIHASIYTTIKSMKFSHLAPVCGGPIELAVITTDRAFRWIRHKDLDSALRYT